MVFGILPPGSISPRTGWTVSGHFFSLFYFGAGCMTTFANVEAALEAVVTHMGGAKLVGGRLFPHKAAIEAQRLLLSCLAMNRLEKLGPNETIKLFAWGREAGFHDAWDWYVDQVGYERSNPDQNHLEKVIRTLTSTLERVTTTLERAIGALEKPAPGSASAT